MNAINLAEINAKLDEIEVRLKARDWWHYETKAPLAALRIALEALDVIEAQRGKRFDSIKLLVRETKCDIAETLEGAAPKYCNHDLDSELKCRKCGKRFRKP